MAVNATAIWRVRVGGSNTNGGGYDAGIASAGTDYSQQDAAQLTLTDVAVTGTTATSVTGGFTAAMIGNAMWLTGGGATAGPYFIMARTDTNTVTLDRTPGTVTAGTGRVGGAWADPWANVASSTYIKAGNIIYVRGAGSNNPTTATYTKSGGGFTDLSPATGDVTNGYIKMIGENGRPLLSSNGLTFYQANRWLFQSLAFIVTGNSNGGTGIIGASSNGTTVQDCSFDQNGYDIRCIGSAPGPIIGCEFFSSTAPRGTQTLAAVSTGNYGAHIGGCSIHDCNAIGASLTSMASLVGNVIVNNRKDGVQVSESSGGFMGSITGNTISGNGGNGGIYIGSAQTAANYPITNNIIANHNGVSQAGIYYGGSGTSAAVTRIFNAIAGNAFYNNTTDATGFTLPSGNTTGTDPQFTGTSTNNFQIGTNLIGLALALPTNTLSGKVTTTSYAAPGAVQRDSNAPTPVINRVTYLLQMDNP